MTLFFHHPSSKSSAGLGRVEVREQSLDVEKGPKSDGRAAHLQANSPKNMMKVSSRINRRYGGGDSAGFAEGGSARKLLGEAPGTRGAAHTRR